MSKPEHRITELPILVIFPHSRCNCRCVMCDIWRIRQTREITAGDLESHLVSFRELKVKWIVFSGGEPLMHSDLGSLCRMCRAQGIRFSEDLEARYFEEIASERIVVRYTRGVPTRLWERKPGMRAECLDATIYGIAVRNLVSVDLERRTAELSSAAAPVRRPQVVRSSWVERRL